MVEPRFDVFMTAFSSLSNGDFEIQTNTEQQISLKA